MRIVERDLDQTVRFHDVTRIDLYDLCDLVDGPVLFSSPTGTGKSYMVLNGSEGDKRVLLVPTVPLCEQLAEDYGVLGVSGSIEEFDTDGLDTIVATYDGMKRIVAQVDPREWSLFIDESHQLALDASYRREAISYIANYSHRFKRTILMSATHVDGPVDVQAIMRVNITHPMVPVFITTSEDYVAIAKSELENDDVDCAIMLINSKSKIEAVRMAMIKEGLTVGVLTSDNKKEDQFKSTLSGEFKPDVILGTSVMRDGINIFPRNNVVVIGHESRLFAEEVKQLSSRMRNSQVFAHPKRVILCAKEHDLNTSDQDRFQTLDELLGEVRGFCERLTALHCYLIEVGQADQPINRAINYAYNDLIEFGENLLGPETPEIRPCLAACTGRIRLSMRRGQTTGDILLGLRKFNMMFKGELTYNDVNSRVKAVDNSKKAITADEKNKTSETIKEVAEVFGMGMSNLVDNMLKDFLSPDSAERHTKKDIEAVKQVAIGYRALKDDPDFSLTKYGELVSSAGTVSALRIQATTAKYHRVLKLAEMGYGVQGQYREDVNLLAQVRIMFGKGSRFTKDTLDFDLDVLGYHEFEGFLLPKNRVRFMRQLFGHNNIKRVKLKHVDGETVTYVNGYEIIGEDLII